MRKLVIVLVVVAVVLIVADRVSLYVAQRKVASRVATAYSLPDAPAVTIQGFPFLTQVAAGNYQQIDVVLTSVTQSGVQLRDLRARFGGVHAPLRQLVGTGTTTSITADQATGTALIPFTTVQERLPAGITLSPDEGNVRLSGRIGYQGLDVPVSAAVSLHVTSDAIEVVPRHLTVGGSVPVPASVLGSRLVIVLPLHDLPMHLQVTSVRVTGSGFEVSATARDVAFVNRG